MSTPNKTKPQGFWRELLKGALLGLVAVPLAIAMIAITAKLEGVALVAVMVVFFVFVAVAVSFGGHIAAHWRHEQEQEKKKQDQGSSTAS